jgi:hypothetical protein
MAFLFPGKTRCPLCGNVIHEGDAVVAFPAFLGPGHPLSRYSDAAFHGACFARCPDEADVSRLFRRYREIWENRPRHMQSTAEIEEWGQKAFKEFQ